MNKPHRADEEDSFLDHVPLGFVRPSGGDSGIHYNAARPPRAAVKVLLIEENTLDASTLMAQLGEFANAPFEVMHAGTLADGLARARQETVDVVLVDLALPDSWGLEAFRRLRAASLPAPIVVYTSLEDEDLALTAVHEGAADYLLKGHVEPNLLCRSLRYAIERHHVQRLETQLQVAREVQQKLFPSEAPVLPGFDIAAGCQPAEATSGDYFDYLPLADGDWGIVIADVSGHGLGPAILMAETRAYLRALTLSETDAGRALTLLNRFLAADTRSEHFVTLFFGKLNPTRRQFIHAGAAHKAFHFDVHGKVITLHSTSLALGVDVDTIHRAEPPIYLEPGAVVLLLTDGIVENFAPNSKDQFGFERVFDVVQRHRHQPAAEIIAALFQAARDFMGHTKQQDDITAVVIKVLPTTHQEPAPI